MSEIRSSISQPPIRLGTPTAGVPRYLLIEVDSPRPGLLPRSGFGWAIGSTTRRPTGSSSLGRAHRLELTGSSSLGRARMRGAETRTRDAAPRAAPRASDAWCGTTAVGPHHFYVAALSR